MITKGHHGRGGCLELIFTKSENLVSLEQFSCKPIGMYGNIPSRLPQNVHFYRFVMRLHQTNKVVSSVKMSPHGGLNTEFSIGVVLGTIIP